MILLFCLCCCRRVSYRQTVWPGIPAVGTVLRQCVSPFHPSLQISQLKTARSACSGVFGLLEKRKGAISCRKGKKIKKNKQKQKNSLSLTGSLFQGLELGQTHQRQSVLSPETHGSEVVTMGTVCQQHKPEPQTAAAQGHTLSSCSTREACSSRFLHSTDRPRP